MRFNPPPNWPQPPAGWSPPPGWEPDPSLPRPPRGWQLWVADDEFVISPSRAAAAREQSSWEQSAWPWYRRTKSIALLMIFALPVGLVLLWMRPDWSVRRRGVITAVVGFVLIIGVASPSPAPTTTTAVLGPTATGGETSSSPTPTSSQTVAPPPAAPSTVATQPPASVTSAPLKTAVAAAPAYTPPAPVHTVNAPPAPRPVQTTPQTQGCYPQTDKGKCYTPGEFCRDSDHGKSGIDADGDAIKCEDNDDWRWERV
jgi:hypothetical protein